MTCLLDLKSSMKTLLPAKDIHRSWALKHQYLLGVPVQPIMVVVCFLPCFKTRPDAATCSAQGTAARGYWSQQRMNFLAPG